MSTPPPSDTQPIPYSLAVFGVPLTPELVAACRLVKDQWKNITTDCYLIEFIDEALATVGA